jgi:hypothetical protein
MFCHLNIAANNHSLNYLVIYLLTHSRSWALLEEPPIAETAFSAFYETRRFNTVFTRAHHWSLTWAISIQSTPIHPKIRFNIDHPPTAWSSQWFLSFWVAANSMLKCLLNFYIHLLFRFSPQFLFVVVQGSSFNARCKYPSIRAVDWKPSKSEGIRLVWKVVRLCTNRSDVV